MPSEYPGELVREEVDHLNSQNCAVDEEMPTLVENGILAVKRVRGLDNQSDSTAKRKRHYDNALLGGNGNTAV